MSMQDSISEMLTTIRNGQISKKEKICTPSSTIKVAIANVLAEEGFIKKYNIKDNVKPVLEIFLKYYQKRKPVIDTIKRISRPGLRIYRKRRELPQVMSGMGIVIISTSKGIITDNKARQLNIGGEIICYVS
ncbi:30S ribosomal protein S8 [Candidatus Blochmannia vicinus]|uniref:Small ribosomal subunit protein uS8 n=1 Tax=Candidatus Blochmannia vicinus (nom. nud.) TaxID=251540 RepID=A0A9Q8TVP3_9ENTR|nr:30S ribosomal protein S8 [Candidatus Blochmannia vicinus]URJ27984.1 30S ribosomal protein S8 [Candidatus Blochmannia vicinus]URJ30744.1 30S ribosomal protein S8 [Candidatus Blochmannia vicinus]URJ32888.1 30S ribosomal protein S8 [Candidatus Blochmannia vicinus]